MFHIQVDSDITLQLVEEHHHRDIFNLIDNNRPYLSRFMGELDESLEATRKRCLRSKEIFASRGSLITMIVYQGQPAGMINLHCQAGSRYTAEIGYWLAEAFVGKGIITRSTHALIDYAFAHTDMNRVVLGIGTDNPRSYAIAERLGFTLEGTLRQNDYINGEWVDHHIYSILKDEWHPLPTSLILCYPLDDQIRLRPVDMRHAEIIFQLIEANREHISEFMPWVDGTQAVDDTRDFIKNSLQQYADNNGWQASIWQGDELIGMIGYVEWNFINNHTEIGYWLAKSSTGQGIITRASRELVRYAIETLKLNRVVIRCASENTNSANVARRLGFTEESMQRQGIKLRDNQYVDVRVFSLLAKEWQPS